MKRLFSVSVLIVLLALPGCILRVVEDIESAPLKAPENATLDQIKQSIVRAGLSKDWQMVEIEPGHLLATTTVNNKHGATVDIFFDTEVFSIRYKDSDNLRYNGRSIHRHYPVWIDNLKNTIQRHVQFMEDT